ncbi:hypothetical protein DUI87_05897 [Hirundo rustica rustica]|uniref:Uncharacterized protein n=1 Tax=Hirundo rustica rustica TaxID=333673 RepID=A0A3M0KWX6_HIRRU|nr:hypothetical protein DUI87_05897 [Hirundo rustica rustica]
MGSNQAGQDSRIKAVISHPQPESRLFYFCHRRSSGLVGKYNNWRLMCESKPQKVPKKLEEPLGEHVAEESHAVLPFSKKSPDMIVKDPATRETESPHDQVTWGRGYAYVSTAPDLNYIEIGIKKPEGKKKEIIMDCRLLQILQMSGRRDLVLEEASKTDSTGSVLYNSYLLDMES